MKQMGAGNTEQLQEREKERRNCNPFSPRTPFFCPPVTRSCLTSVLAPQLQLPNYSIMPASKLVLLLSTLTLLATAVVAAPVVEGNSNTTFVQLSSKYLG